MILRSDFIEKINQLGRNRKEFFILIDFLGTKPLVFSKEEAGELGLEFNFDHEGLSSQKKTIHIEFEKMPMAFEKYHKAFEKVMYHIQRGDTFLLNLTFPTPINTNLNLKEIFDFSSAKYKLLMPDEFVVFSPEPFIIINENKIFSYPMKGTIDASVPDAEKILMNDLKEQAEHNTIVDLIRNDLSMVAKKVRVEKFRYVEEIITHEKKLLQTSSVICGQLEQNWQNRLGDIFNLLLPAGSISGAPKKKTIDIINKTEGYDRGYFSGVMAYFDGENLQSAVMIRFIEKIGDQLYFKSGGGITHFSKAKDEYEEMIQKVYVPII